MRTINEAFGCGETEPHILFRLASAVGKVSGIRLGEKLVSHGDTEARRPIENKDRCSLAFLIVSDRYSP